MRGISVLAIVVGAAADLILTIVLSGLLEVWVYATTDLIHLPREQAQAALAAAMQGATAPHIAQLFLGFACSVLGGVIAASLARERHLLNSVLAGVLITLFNLLLFARGVNGGSALELGLIALTFACYPLGGALRL